MESEPETEGSPPDSDAAPSLPTRKTWVKLAAIVVTALVLIAAVAFLVRPQNQAPTLHEATVSSEIASTTTTLTFTGVATDPDGDSIAYAWNFGDNSTATGTSPTHRYPVPGRYVVLLTVTDGKGGEATNDGALLHIVVRLPKSDLAAPAPPGPGLCSAGCILGPAAAILSADRTAVSAGTAVRFSANASWAYTWTWNNASNRTEGGSANAVPVVDDPSLFTTFTYGWGDGTNTGGNSNTVGLTSHVFSSPGNYFVRLTLTVPALAGTLTVSAGHTVRVTATAPVAGTRSPDIFTTATFGDPDTLDPAVNAETSGGEVLQNVYETLVWYQAGTEDVTELVPRLAIDVPTMANGGISPDGKNYTFTIRSNVRFHSNAIMTPEDVVYSIRRVLAIHDPDGPSWIFEQVLTNHVVRYLADDCGPGANQTCTLADYADSAFPSRAAIPENIRTALGPESNWTLTPLNDSIAWDVSNSTIEKTGPGQITIHLTRPYPAFLQTLAFTAGSVVEKACAEDQDGWATRNVFLDRQGDCGTGPFRLDSWVPNQVVVLHRFDAYWGNPASVRQVHIEKANDVFTREFMLLSGDADAAAIGRSHQFDVMNLDGTPKYNWLRIVKDSPSFDVTVFGYNQAINASASPDLLEVPVTFFSDIHVRRAFSYAFDYNGFLENVTHGTGIQLRGPIAQGIPGYNTSTPLFTYNLTRATAELQQTTYWTDGFNITLYYNAGNTERREGCLLLKQGLEALDTQAGAGPISVTIAPLDWPSYLGTFRAGGLPIFFLGWRPDYADPDDYVMPFLHSNGLFAGRIGYSNGTLDALIDAAASELNETLRSRMYQDLSTRAVVDDVAYLWVYQSSSFHVERSWVRGYYFNPMLSGLDYYRLSKAPS
jgi:peptide/nickel transport system substrate-binding protein